MSRAGARAEHVVLPPDGRSAARRVPPSLLLASALLALTVLAYLPSLDGGFVWDDVILIRDNPVLCSAAALREAAAGDLFAGTKGELSTASGYVRPLVTLLNGATLALLGPAPFPFRLTNLLLHLGVGLLLWRLLHRLGLDHVPAALGLGLFTLHPVQTEAVAFISGRPDLLAAFFCLLALHLYLAARRAPYWKRALAGGVAAALCFLLAVAAKEVALLLPLLLAVMEALGLVGSPPPLPGAGGSALAWRRRLFPALALGLLAMLAAGLRLATLPPAATPAHAAITGAPLLVVAANLTGLYARLLVWPVGLHVGYEGFPAAAPGLLTLLGGICWSGVLLAVVLGRRRAPRAVLAALWGLLFLLPVLQLVPIRSLAAERYLYLPSMGLALGLALALQRLERPGGRGVGGGGGGDEGSGGGKRLLPLRAAAAVVVLLLLLLCAWATLGRALDWRDELSLWSAELSRGQGGVTAYQNLAAALAEQGRRPEAAALLQLAWQERPGHPIVFRTIARLAVEGYLAGCPPLPVELRRPFLDVALSPRPSPDGLQHWSTILRQAGCVQLAELCDLMAAQPAAGGPAR